MDKPAKRSPIGLAAAGFASALISIGFQNEWFLGAIFGAVLGVYFAWFEGLRSPFKFVVFVIACGAAYPFATLIVGVSRLWSPGEIYFNLAQFFVGGGAGAFIVLLAGTLLFGPAEMRGDTLGLAFFGGLGGSILGLFGGELERAIGPHRPGDIGMSVYFVWQTGVALILGLLLRWGQKRYSQYGLQ